MIAKIINWVKKYQRDIFLAFCILLIVFIAYNVGQIRALKKTPITFSQDAVIYQASSPDNSAAVIKNSLTPSAPKDSRVVTSKKSKSKVYHYTWCSGAKRIKDENKIWFSSANEAESRGYTLAGNCN